ncbi:hypothetical protein Bca4012_025028 [Brassica carinata]|uniref:Uncharacterized protein n=1 Tax=Brassica carinata TaxID=52824 RepID=A0A8X7P2Y0_BRACI|nr:hypothetical protein Bca52824_094123 [Brassica carinata]
MAIGKKISRSIFKEKTAFHSAPNNTKMGRLWVKTQLHRKSRHGVAERSCHPPSDEYRNWI